MEKSNRDNQFLKWVITFLVLVLLPAFGTAWGQGAADEKAADDDFTLPEMVVTAEFRKKEIQDTPLSITAVNSDTLESRNQITLDQVSAQAPNVSLRAANASSGKSLVAYIRGIGQFDFNPSVESGVGIYVDDVYYSTITGNVLDLLDIDRVEILRGPQGTLAGRNALGGAIKVFSRKPQGTDEGFFQTTFGSYHRIDVKGAGDFAIRDNLFLRIAGASRSSEGYVTRYDYACKNNLPAPGTPGGLTTYVPLGSDCELGKEGGQDMTAGRVSLRWEPTDKLEVNFSTNIVNDRSEPTPSILIQARDTSVSSLLDPSYPTTVPMWFDNDGDGVYTPGVDVGFGNHFATPGTYYNYSTYIDDGTSTPDPRFQGGTPGGDINVYKPFVAPAINNLESEDYTLRIDNKFNKNVSGLLIASYRKYENTFADDFDGSPLGIRTLLQRMKHEQSTIEARINATLWDDFLDLTLGAFYLDQETKEDARVALNYAGFDVIYGPDKVPSSSKAVYGQFGLNLTDRLNLTLGLRFTKDEKSYTYNRTNPDGTAPAAYNPFAPGTVFPFALPFDAGQPANNLFAGYTGLNISYDNDRFDYRVALDYDVAENIMLYGQVATGYRAGGNNARPFFPSQIHAYEPEEVISYEMGMKSKLWDQLRFNASIFFNDYTDIQLPLTTCFWAPAAPINEQVPCLSLENVGDAEVKGAEVEAMWRPTKSLSVDFSFSWIDFKYTRLEYTEVSADNKAPYSPEFKWSSGIQYRFYLGNLGDLTPRVDITWQDDIFTDATNSPLGIINDYYLVNGRLTWTSPEAKWQAALEATNLLDEYYYLSITDQLDSAGLINGQPGRPREWAFSIKRSWFF